MNKKKAIIILVVAVLAIGIGVLLFHRDHTEYVDAANEEDVKWAYELLAGSLTSSEVMYCDYLAYAKEAAGTGSYTAGEKETKVIDYKEATTYTVEVPAAGWYYLSLAYKPEGSTLSDFAVDVSINGEQAYYEMKTIALPLTWKDETKAFPVDGYGDESAPKQVRVDDWRTTYLFNNTYSSDTPLLFPLKKGANEITFTNISSDGLMLGGP